MMSDPGEFTRLLKRYAEGDTTARDAMFTQVYPELRRIAALHLRREKPGHTLQPTALLHEAYLKLTEGQRIDFNGRGHFFAICARLIRQILVSHARSKYSGKRGGYQEKIDLETVFNHGATPEPLLLLLNDALDCLERESPRAYQLVELKFFAGFDFDEASQILGVSSRTLKRDWEAAKKWLYREMKHPRNQ